MAAAKPYIAESDQKLSRFLTPGRSVGDYAGWLDFGDDAVPDRAEFSVE